MFKLSDDETHDTFVQSSTSTEENQQDLSELESADLLLAEAFSPRILNSPNQLSTSKDSAEDFTVQEVIDYAKCFPTLPSTECTCSSYHSTNFSIPCHTTQPCGTKEELDDPNLINRGLLSDSSSLGPVESWSNADLAELLKNSELMDALVATSPMVVRLENEKAMLNYEIGQLARENIAKQQELDNVREQVNAKAVELKDLLERVDKSNASYKNLAEAYNPNNIREALHTSVMEKDEESEKVAEKFLQGGVDVEDFINTYTGYRKLSHIRKIKHDKLYNQLKKFEQAGL